jgi:hypothetical protein
MWRGPVSLTLFTLSVWAESPPEPLPAFEVASAKVTPPGSFGYTSWSPYGISRDQILGIEKLGAEQVLEEPGQ